MTSNKLSLFFLIILLFSGSSAHAFKNLILSPNVKRFADEAIERFVEISKKPGGTKQIGKELGAMQLPDEVLEDTFLRISVARQLVTRDEAIGLFSRLSGVKGFRSTLRKIIGNSNQVTKGHLAELRIAAEVHDEGFVVREIGRSFPDGIKQWTDIDIVLEKNGKTLLVESKDYAKNRPIDIIAIRKDMDTLNEYHAHIGNVPAIPILSFSNVPGNPNTLNLLRREAKKRKIELVFGSPREQAIQYKQLEKIL